MKLPGFLILTIFSITSMAENETTIKKLNLSLKALKSDIEVKPSPSKKNFKLSFGLIFINSRIYRGALISDTPLIFLGPRITLFNKITFKGPGFTYTKNFGKRHKLSTSTYYFNDQPQKGLAILLGRKKKEDYKSKRPSTWETSLKYEYKYKMLFGFSLDYHKDINGHLGNYVSISFNTGILKYITLKIDFGIGDKISNQYTYGPEGVSGLGHITYSLGSFFPILPWNGRLIPFYKMSTIQQKQNKNADFVRKQDVNHTFNVLFSWKIY